MCPYTMTISNGRARSYVAENLFPCTTYYVRVAVMHESTAAFAIEAAMGQPEEVYAKTMVGGESAKPQNFTEIVQ